MDLLQKQSYNLWYSFLLDKLSTWKNDKPKNKDLKNCVRAITRIGLFNNNLLIENDLLRKKNREIIIHKNKEILKLKEELKQYEF